jgi:hypothetical protein
MQEVLGQVYKHPQLNSAQLLKKLQALYGTRKRVVEFCCLYVFMEVHNHQTINIHLKGD